MSDDPAVEAAQEFAVTLYPSTAPELVRAIAAAAVEAARPIIEAEVRAEIADEIRVLVRLRDAVIEQCIDDYMAEHGLTSVRAAVRTEPER